MPRRIAFLLGLLLLAPAALAQGAFDEMLPDTTVFYASLENLGRSAERIKASPLHALWNDEAMKAFTERPLAKWAELMKDAKDDTGFSPDELLDVVKGQLAFAVTSIGTMGDKGKDVHALFLADIGANAGKLNELITRAEQRANEKTPTRREEEEFSGVTIVRYLKAEGEEGADNEQGAWFLDGSLFCFGDGVETLRQVLAQRGNPEAGSLASNETYRKTRARLGGRGDIVAYLGANRLWAAMRESDGMSEKVEKVLDAIGLLSIEAVALEGTISENAVTLNVHVPVAGPKHGLLKLFDGRNAAHTPPRWVPDDAIGVGMFSLSIGDLWAEAVSVLNKIEPGMGMMMDASLESVKAQTGVDLKQDVFGSLGDTMTFFMKVADPNEPGAFIPGPAGMMQMPQFGFAMSVTNQQALDNAMNGLLAQFVAGGMVTEEEYLDTKMRVIQTGAGFNPAFAVLPDVMVFTMRTDDLKDVISRHGKEDVRTLMDRPGFKDAAQAVPGEVCMLGYDDMAQALSNSVLLQSLEMLGGLNEIIDKDKWPGAEVLGKYLGIRANWATNEEDGIFVGYVMTLKPGKSGTEPE